jgi:hypothetical protein
MFMSPSSPTSFPFYSSEVRETLVKIIANIDGREEGEDGAIITEMKSKQRHGAAAIAIRGKWSGGGYASSSSSDDDNDKLVDISEDDESSTSTSSHRSLTGGVVEEYDGNNNYRRENLDRGGRHAPASKSTTKISHNKDDKNVVLQRMGRPPTILLPLEAMPSATNADTAKKSEASSSNRTDSKTMQAIEIPSVLLPINYLRDNPNWKVSSVAQILLTFWERLHHSSIASSPSSSSAPTIIVILLQSGRFASAVYSIQQQTKHSTSPIMTMIAHKTSTRYTVRKGQGGSQSNHDQSKHKAKSIGAQLRREGERQLRSDVHETWKNWKGMGYVHTNNCVGVYVSCPKGMRRDYLYTNNTDDGNATSSGGAGSNGLLDKKDDRWRNIPLDVGRPTLEAASAVLECLLSCTLREMTEGGCRSRSRIGATSLGDDETKDIGNEVVTKKNMEDSLQTKEIAERTLQESAVVDVKPYTPLHEAIQDGDLNRLMELLDLLDLKESQEKCVDETLTTTTTCDNNHNGQEGSIGYDINTGGGPECFTPLHLASSCTHPNATALLTALLIHGHANPCAVDVRGRVPYFVAASDKHRESFRLARGTLGEEYCSWDEGAKVGPALSESDVQLKKAKALEKKRRQRARQKENRAIEKEEAEREQAEEQARLAKLKQEEDAKRIRDGLKPKPSSATNVCDFCQKIVKGKRRSQMFQRLDYAYCSTECVKRHQRELMAAAATARLGGGK